MQASHSANLSQPQVQESKKVAQAAEQVIPAEFNDTLLSTFSEAQKAYIVKNLYPEISKALVHFISEAKRHQQIREEDAFCSSPPARLVQSNSQSAFESTFKMNPIESPMGVRAQPSNMQINKASPAQKIGGQQAAPQRSSVFGSGGSTAGGPAQSSFSTFGGYKMQAVAPVEVAAVEKSQQKEQPLTQAIAEPQKKAEQASIPSYSKQSSMSKTTASKRKGTKPAGSASAMSNNRLGPGRTSFGNSLLNKYDPLNTGAKKDSRLHKRSEHARPGSSPTKIKGQKPRTPSANQKAKNTYARISTSKQYNTADPSFVGRVPASAQAARRTDKGLLFSPQANNNMTDSVVLQQNESSMRYSMDSEQQKLQRGTSQSALGHNAGKHPGSAARNQTSKFSESVLNHKKKSGVSTNSVRLAGVYKIPTSIQTSYQPRGMANTPLSNQRKGAPKKFLTGSTAKTTTSASAIQQKKNLDQFNVRPSSPTTKQQAPSLSSAQPASSQAAAQPQPQQPRSAFGGGYKMQTQQKTPTEEAKSAAPVNNSYGGVNLQINNATLPATDSSKPKASTFSSQFTFGSSKAENEQQQPAFKAPAQHQSSFNNQYSMGSPQQEDPSKQQQQLPQKKSSFGSFAFGQPTPQEGADSQPKQFSLNYGGFGGGAGIGADKKRTASLPSNNFKPFGQQAAFKPVEQFRISLAEVAKGKINSRVFNQTAPGATPDAAYLKSKRGSVFHKAFDSTGQVLKDFVAPTFPKSEESEKSLVALFKTSFLTKNTDPKNHQVLAKAMFNRCFKQGQTIIKYGEMGSEYFALANGQIKVTVYKPGTNPDDPNLADHITIEKVLEAKNNELIGFGEIALLYNDKRTASITAITDCDTWVLQGNVFKQIIAVNTIRRRNINLEYLDKVELFKNLEQYEKIKLLDGLKVDKMDKDEYVFHQGDKGDNFFIIEEGQIECGSEIQHPNGSHDFKVIRQLNQGDHFGEIALINNVKRTLTVRSSAPQTQLLSLSKSAFTRILGSIKQYLKEDYTQQQSMGVASVDGSFMSENQDNSQNNSFISGQKLYGIKEEEYEEPLNSGRRGTTDLQKLGAQIVQAQTSNER